MRRVFNARWFGLAGLSREAVEYLRRNDEDLTAAQDAMIPAGGTANQVLKKIDGTDYSTEWAAVDHAELDNIQGGAVGERNHLTNAQVSALHARSHAITSTSDHTAGNWNVLYTNGAGEVVELALGDSGKVLASNGAASAPSFEAINRTKSVTILAPTNAEDVSLWYQAGAATITSIEAILTGSSTPSVTWTVRHGSDRSSTGTEVVTGGSTTTETTTPDVVSVFDDATITAGSHVWLETTAQSGTVDSLNITITYTE